MHKIYKNRDFVITTSSVHDTGIIAVCACITPNKPETYTSIHFGSLSICGGDIVYKDYEYDDLSFNIHIDDIKDIGDMTEFIYNKAPEYIYEKLKSKGFSSIDFQSIESFCKTISALK